MEERKNIDNSSWYAPNAPDTEVTDVFEEAGLYTLRSREELIAENKPKKGRTALKVVLWTVLIVSVIALSALIFGDGDTDSAAGGSFEDYKDFYEQTEDSEITGENEIPRADTNPDLELELQSSQGLTALPLTEVYAKCQPSVVGISTYVDGKPYGWGSGVIMTADGYIITNTHVLDGADSAEVILHDGTTYEAKLVGADAISDIGVLKISAKNLPAAEFADSSEVLVGQQAIAIGNPLDVEFSGTMTVGIISGVSREMNYDGRTMILLQTDAALNPGNSGGALFNAYGQVIGITNMKMIGSILSYAEGVGFAIPTVTVKDMADAILDDGAVVGRPAIGIMVYEVEEAADGTPGGVLVDTVKPNTDAEAKGLLPGDIITHIDGKVITSMEVVQKAVNDKRVGDTIKLTVWREGETLELRIKLIDQNDS